MPLRESGIWRECGKVKGLSIKECTIIIINLLFDFISFPTYFLKNYKGEKMYLQATSKYTEVGTCFVAEIRRSRKSTKEGNKKVTTTPTKLYSIK